LAVYGGAVIAGEFGDVGKPQRLVLVREHVEEAHQLEARGEGLRARNDLAVGTTTVGSIGWNSHAGSPPKPLTCDLDNSYCNGMCDVVN